MSATEDWRACFHVPETPYFLSHSVGLRPKAADAYVEEKAFAPWRAGRGEAWGPWSEAIEDFHANLAAVIGARREDVCAQHNVSSALTKILFGLPPDPRRKRIVLAECDFPTIGFVLKQAERLGYELDYLPAGPHLADPDAWARAFADDVFLVHVTHVFSNLCLKTPVREITARARAAGVWSVVDAAQSAGATDVDVADWSADFVIGTCVKYLCGGPGAGWLWADRAAADRCEPMDVGWFSHEDPFAFDIRAFRYAEGAARFTGGTQSPTALANAAAGLAAIRDAGPAAVAARNQRTLDSLLERVDPDIVISHATPGERGAACVLRPRDIAAARAALKEAGAAFDERAGGIRLSVHLYTNDIEVVGAL
ncbi:MAG: aminotransferase class V-fold PLP-dependent enzyme [Parvularculaceae bacterium]